MIYNRLLSIENIGTIVGAVLHLAGTQAPIRTSGNQASRTSRLAAQPVQRLTRPPVKSRFGFALRSTALAGLGLLALAGCGDNYHPVISAINPVGPAGQPTKYAVVISNPGPGLPGLVNFVDFSGDTVLITADIGVNPQYLILGASGTQGYTINGDGTISSFAISTALLSSAVDSTTLLPNTNPSSIFPEGTFTYITQPGDGSLVPPTVGEFTGVPPSLQQNISSIGPNPVFIAGIAAAPRVYAISTGSPAGSACSGGSVGAIETTTNSVSSTLCAGTDPIYGVMTADTRRAFIINHGSNNVTVINSQQNTLDAGVASGIIADPSAVAPVWADFAPTLNELVVANQGTGTSKGSVSIFSIPLCNAAALATNPNCNLNDPVDAVGFGNLVASIPVGVNPTMVAVMQDGSQAFVINQADSTVSAINLTTDTVIATIPVPATPNPTFLAVTTGSPGFPGKVYVTSTGSTTMTVIRSDTDTVDTTVPLQGTGVQVRVTLP